MSPPDGTVVHPGETITVEVHVASGAGSPVVGIISPIGIASQLKKDSPYTFTVQIPTSEVPGSSGPLLGKQPIYALAVAPGAELDSAPVTMDVERQDLPVSLTPQIPQLIFKSVGETFPLIMLGKFADGLILEVNQSTYFSFASSNTTVATVDNFGLVTAAGPGSAAIIATYAYRGKNIAARVSATLVKLPKRVGAAR